MATAKPASSAVEGGGKSVQKKMGKAKPTLGKMSGPVHMLYRLLSLDESRKYQFGENETSTTSLFHSLKTYWKTVLGLRLVSCDICVPF